MPTDYIETTTTQQLLSDVVFTDLHGQSVITHLSVPVLVAACIRSPFALCRMCATRMSFRTLEKVLLGMFLDDAEYGYTDGYSYYELASIVGKGVHSVKNAIAELKKSGVIMTSCKGKGCSRIAVSVEAFVRWARTIIPNGQQAPRNTSDNTPYSTPEPFVGNETPSHPETRDGAISGVICDTVTKRAKRSRKPKSALVAKKESGAIAPSGTQPPAGFDPLAMAAPYEGEFDASEEIADTLRVAGRTAVSIDDDEDDISFGAETAETDMGYGVRMNVNI